MIHRSNVVDYSLITETPGAEATIEQIERLYQRYHFARQFAKGADVVEAACGSGMGLEYLAATAANVIGGDIDEKNVSLAKKHHESSEKVDVRLMDAHDIDLPDRNADLVILFEAIYYLHDPEKFIKEAHRILRKDGKVIICTANKDWEDFHPSPFTHGYFSVPELFDLLRSEFSEIKFYGGFPVEKGGIKDKLVSLIKRIALKFDLIPGSLKARTYLKRIFMGKLKPLPERICENMSAYEEPREISTDRESRDFKIIYAVAKK
ncbi:class I SAM-dependent methyltransferase [Candidatus Omnitrophota bacterium]